LGALFCSHSKRRKRSQNTSKNLHALTVLEKLVVWEGVLFGGERKFLREKNKGFSENKGGSSLKKTGTAMIQEKGE